MSFEKTMNSYFTVKSHSKSERFNNLELLRNLRQALGATAATYDGDLKDLYVSYDKENPIVKMATSATKNKCVHNDTVIDLLTAIRAIAVAEYEYGKACKAIAEGEKERKALASTPKASKPRVRLDLVDIPEDEQTHLKTPFSKRFSRIEL
jgi:hypothetical protein